MDVSIRRIDKWLVVVFNKGQGPASKIWLFLVSSGHTYKTVCSIDCFYMCMCVSIYVDAHTMHVGCLGDAHKGRLVRHLYVTQ